MEFLELRGLIELLVKQTASDRDLQLKMARLQKSYDEQRDSK